MSARLIGALDWFSIHRINEKRKKERTLKIISEKDVHRKTHSHRSTNEKNVRIIHELEDVTPLPLHSEKYKNIDDFQDSLFTDVRRDDRKKRLSIISNVSERFSWPSRIRDSPRNQTPFSMGSGIFNNYLETNIGIVEDDNAEAPSGIYLPVTYTKMAFPEEITVCLEETETVFLFEMPSVTVIKGTDEGDIAEKQNKNYEYITVGKGRNRKTVSTEAQTNECILKTRHTLAPRTVNKNNYAFASAWDMYDSFKPGEDEKAVNREFNEISTIEKDTESESEIIKDDLNLMHNLRFLDSIITMNRVLANNVFKKQQEIYKGLTETEILSESKNKCQLQLLWTFSSDDTINRTVKEVCYNTFNNDIIAVGYGKFKYSENKDGLVCVWSIKNPTQPERIYHFESPVTSMAFSHGNPNFLAVGFYNGTEIVIDVTANKKTIIAQSSRKTSSSYEPIWHTLWCYGEDLHANSEQVITVGQDGRICRFIQTKTKEFVCTPMMRITRTEENIPDTTEDKCKTNDIPILIYPPCLLFCQHPQLKDIYFIGTADGCIYKCSTNYLNQHISVLYAHDGPVYGMQFSHFCPKVFITCGADWTVKVWVEDVSEPLIVLTTDMNPVESAVFCPTHSTIIAAVSGTKIFLWDLQQKIDMLSLEINLPPVLKKLTVIKFTRTGKNLIIADIIGGVHIYTLIGLPANPDHQASLLEESLRKALTIKPDLLMKMKKVGRLS